ncbi:MAG TPA: hypothetical protein VK858_17205 [Longimicrobiales bacterium]|nr:hypothetical protein [Longimicrobiales bacterium]
MQPETPPIHTVPRPGVWRAAPAELFGGFLLGVARMLDKMMPLRLFEPMVRVIWNVVQRSGRQEFPLEVRNCGTIIHMAGIDFHRIEDGLYANVEDPTRAPTGAAMFYNLRVVDRGTITGDGFLTAPATLVGAAAHVKMTLRKGEDDHWLRLCEVVPECDDLDGGTCG